MSESEGGGLPNFGELMQTAQRMQQEMARIQSELGQKTVEGSSGGGMIKAVANGRQQLVSITIESELIDPEDPGMLQDLVVAAVNQALARASELAKQELSSVAGGLPIKIPGLM
jgi:DNA-binding YbaB/EbfC family protein